MGKTKQSLTIELSDPAALERAALDAAGGMLIGAIAALIESGEKPHVAFRLACYLLLSEQYGREFVRDEFGISERVERLWRARVREAVDSLGDDAQERMAALAQRAGLAAYTHRPPASGVS